MSTENVHWIETNRRNDAEILSKIAGCDAGTIVLCRMENVNGGEWAPVKASSPGTVLLASFAGLEALPLEVTKDWPFSVRLLVVELSNLAAISLPGQKAGQIVRDNSVRTLLELILRCHDAGLQIDHVNLAPPHHQDWKALVPVAAPGIRKLAPMSAPMPSIYRRHIQQLTDVKQTGTPDATALRAGLFQWHDALDESHECSQSIEGQGRHRAGDYWHAIMHRREPDYGNSKYWFRRVGSHPIFPELARRAEPIISVSLPDWKDRLLRGGWDPFAFVDLCESVAGKQQPDREAAAETLQEIEMLLLLGSTYQDATSR